MNLNISDEDYTNALCSLLEFDLKWGDRLLDLLPGFGFGLVNNENSVEQKFCLTTSLRFEAVVEPGPTYTFTQGAGLAIIDAALRANGLSWFKTNDEDKFVDYSHCTIPLFPRCPTVPQLQQVLQVMVDGFNYLIYHEQAHFASGHHALRPSTDLKLAYHESPALRAPEAIDGLKIIRALEIEADMNAIHFFIRAPFTPDKYPSVSEPNLDRLKDMVLKRLVGVFCVAIILSSIDSKISRGMFQRMHPPAPLRIHWMIAAMQGALHQLEFDEQFINQVGAGAVLMAKAVCSSLGCDDSSLDLVSALQQNSLATDHPYRIMHYEIEETLAELKVSNPISSRLPQYGIVLTATHTNPRFY